MNNQHYGLIYKITCTINGKIYIGQTIQPLQARWVAHKYIAKKEFKDKSNKFYNAIRKYGFENFSCKILCYANSREELDHREQVCIRLFKSQENGYNTHEGGLSQRLSIETRAKISAANKGQKRSKEAIENIRKSQIGKKLSKIHRERCSTSQLGEKAAWYGRKHTEESKRKIGSSQKGKPREYLKERVGEKHPMYGKTHSEEARLKMSITRKNMPLPKQLQNEKGENHPRFGKSHSEEARLKMSKAKKGKLLSEETKAKMRQAHIRRQFQKK